jgi:hypothetical protein
MDFNEQGASLGRTFHHIPERTYLYCDRYIAAHPHQSISVGMNADGRIRLLCHTAGCVEDDAIPDRSLLLGGSASLGPFRCSVVPAGTRCVIEKTGRGFLLGAHRVTLDLG